MSNGEPVDCANCTRYVGRDVPVYGSKPISTPALDRLQQMIEARLKTIELKLDNFREEYHDNTIDYHPQNDGIPDILSAIPMIGPIKPGYGPLDIKGTHNECKMPVTVMPVVILDWDGTVVDLGRNWKGAMYDVFMDHLPLKAQEHFKEIVDYINDSEGKHTTEQFKWMIEFGNSLDPGWACYLGEVIMKFEQRMINLSWNKINSELPESYLVPGVIEYLKSCFDAKIDVYVVSGSLKDHIIDIANRLNLHNYFKDIYAITKNDIFNGTHFSKDEGVKKVIGLYAPGTKFVGFGDTESDMELYRVNGVYANLVGMNKPFPEMIETPF